MTLKQLKTHAAFGEAVDSQRNWTALQGGRTACMYRLRALAAIAITLCFAPSSYAQVVWSDEFNGDQIDSSVWTYDVGGHGFGNGQLEFDTARRENSYIEDGNLVIEARREDYQGKSFTSARILTQGRFAFRYGTLEARIKVPDTADGLWPAFWMLGNNFPAIKWPKCGEIDILEMGGKDGIAAGLQHRKINAAIHYAGSDGQYAMKAAWHDASQNLQKDYHLYRVSWTPQYLKVFLDDTEFASWDIAADGLREYHQPFFVILNLAIGGWDSSYTGVSSPTAVTAKFPAKMYIDWIRLSANEHTKVYLGKEAEEAGNFGVFTESAQIQRSVAYSDGSDSDFECERAAALYTWNNMSPSSPPQSASEGSECWSFDIKAGDWFGMGVLLPTFRNMANYSDGLLHFDIRSNCQIPMKVGIKSSRGGEFFLPLLDETGEFGFARDGKWHTVTIPLNRFANTDFQTIHQVFMIAGDAPTADAQLSIDNVWWQPSVPRPAPSHGAFGIYTETPAHQDAGEFSLGKDGDFFIWEATLTKDREDPREGRMSQSVKSAPGLNWFGAAFTPNVKHDLSAYQRVGGSLHFSLKTNSSTKFSIGMKSGNMDGVGQWWLPFRPGADPAGFARDGEWHEIEIPLSQIASEVDLSQVSQLFQILGTQGPISNVELDDIYITDDSDKGAKTPDKN